MTNEISYLPTSLTGVLFVCLFQVFFFFFFFLTVFCNRSFPVEAINCLETGQLSKSALPVSFSSLLIQCMRSLLERLSSHSSL